MQFMHSVFVSLSGFFNALDFTSAGRAGESSGAPAPSASSDAEKVDSSVRGAWWGGATSPRSSCGSRRRHNSFFFCTLDKTLP